jgi:hypothetical protein
LEAKDASGSGSEEEAEEAEEQGDALAAIPDSSEDGQEQRAADAEPNMQQIDQDIADAEAVERGEQGAAAVCGLGRRFGKKGGSKAVKPKSKKRVAVEEEDEQPRKRRKQLTDEENES